jgi:uncharacterized BrkB/YihY/UPF0761 family membrane protein
MPITATAIWSLLRQTVLSWLDDYAPSMGAALSYYMLFSLAPLLVIVIAIAGMVFGHDAAQGAIIGQLQGIMGKETTPFLLAEIAGVTAGRSLAANIALVKHNAKVAAAIAVAFAEQVS